MATVGLLTVSDGRPRVHCDLVAFSTGVERQIANALEQLTKCRTIAEVRAQDERVDEEADETFKLGAISIGDARPDEDVRLIRVAMKQ